MECIVPEVETIRKDSRKVKVNEQYDALIEDQSVLEELVVQMNTMIHLMSSYLEKQEVSEFLSLSYTQEDQYCSNYVRQHLGGLPNPKNSEVIAYYTTASFGDEFRYLTTIMYQLNKKHSVVREYPILVWKNNKDSYLITRKSVYSEEKIWTTREFIKVLENIEDCKNGEIKDYIMSALNEIMNFNGSKTPLGFSFDKELDDILENSEITFEKCCKFANQQLELMSYDTKSKFYIHGENKNFDTKLGTANSAYGIESTDDVILVFDDTCFGSCKNGFIITSDYFYARPAAESFIKLPLKDIKSFMLEKKLLSTIVNVQRANNAISKFSLTLTSKADVPRVQSLLNKLRDYLITREQVSKTNFDVSMKAYQDKRKLKNKQFEVGIFNENHSKILNELVEQCSNMKFKEYLKTAIISQKDSEQIKTLKQSFHSTSQEVLLLYHPKLDHLLVTNQTIYVKTPWNQVYAIPMELIQNAVPNHKSISLVIENKRLITLDQQVPEDIRKDLSDCIMSLKSILLNTSAQPGKKKEPEVKTVPEKVTSILDKTSELSNKVGEKKDDVIAVKIPPRESIKNASHVSTTSSNQAEVSSDQREPKNSFEQMSTRELCELYVKAEFLRCRSNVQYVCSARREELINLIQKDPGFFGKIPATEDAFVWINIIPNPVLVTAEHLYYRVDGKYCISSSWKDIHFFGVDTGFFSNTLYIKEESGAKRQIKTTLPLTEMNNLSDLLNSIRGFICAKRENQIRMVYNVTTRLASQQINTIPATPVQPNTKVVQPQRVQPQVSVPPQSTVWPQSNTVQQRVQPQVNVAPQQVTQIKRFCTNCGNKLVPDDRFCSNCGTRV